MAKLTAIEWDLSEARVVTGRTRGNDLYVEQAFAVELARGDESSSDDLDVGPRLAAALASRGIGRGEVLVAVGRANIELRRMQLPPAPDEELPDLVRFQAMRQFTTIGEDWPLDFIPLGRSETAVDVLAAAIAPQVVKQINEACRACDLQPKRLVLRPFAAASLLARARGIDSRVQLVIDILATDADLFVLADGVVAFMRTVRLPAATAGATVRNTALLGEVRRTIAAAQSQLGGRRVESIMALGDPAQHSEWIELLRKQLSLPIECFDPFSAVQSDPAAREAAGDTTARYAPLLGLLLDEVHDGKPPMDFLHPRKRPEPKSRRERVLLMATVAVAVGCLLAVGLKMHLDHKDRRIAALTAELNSMKAGVDAAKKKAADLKQVESFLASSVPWLDELKYLSENFPPPRDAIVKQFTATLQPDGQGRITIDGSATSPENVEAHQQKVRDEAHRIVGRSTSQDPSGGTYAWRFSESILVLPEKLIPVAAQASGTPAKDAPPAESRGGAAPGNAPETPPPEDSPSDDRPETSPRNTESDKTFTSETVDGRAS